MKKSDILKALAPFGDDDNIILGEYNMKHACELKPRLVCGGTQAYMPYYCVLDPGHDGPCWCSCKNVDFIPETPEEIESFYKEVNAGFPNG